MKPFNLAQIIFIVTIFHSTIALPSLFGKGAGSCIADHCSSELTQCMIDGKCRQAVLCNGGCLVQSDPDSNHLTS